MILAKAPIGDQAWLLADWLEFQVLTSEFYVYRVNELIRLSDEDQDSENPNITEQDTVNEEVLQTALNELQFRVDTLELSYPFHFEGNGSELVLNEPITSGGYVYLYCLFFSHVKRGEVIIPDPPYSNIDRDLLQICSTLAAAGSLQANAVSFGFPRPDNSNFINALKDTWDKLGDGKVVDTIPIGAPKDEKDGRIDVIAWTSTPDNAAGKHYLLGQVATGANWNSKSILGEMEPFHKTWFTRAPASTPTPAMFIPFCLDVTPPATLKDAVYYATLKFGLIYYRYRLPYYAHIGYELAENNTKGLFIERSDEFHKVEKYVDDFRSNVLSYQ
ncbi:MAG: hypothetical protein M0Q44_10165 [Methylobacter sp.]|jgi:hypothetical protein|nr:hypothetical protein [Methylobacter sp.]